MGMTGLHILGIIFGLIAIVFGSIQLIKYRFRVFQQEHLQRIKRSEVPGNMKSGRRHYPQVDVFEHRALFFQIGLLIAIAFVYGVMEWTNSEARLPTGNRIVDQVNILEIEDIPLTMHKRPPLPKTPVEWREVVADPEVMIDLMEEELSPDKKIISISPDTRDFSGERSADVAPVVRPIPPREENRLWVVAEDMPRFPGCEDLASKKEKEACAQQALLSFIYAHIQYPALASKNGIEGTAVITFIVEKDGSVQSAEVVREIGGGCGQEALRVIELMNTEGIRWIAGRQQERPVRVQFNLPVKFKLQ